MAEQFDVAAGNVVAALRAAGGEPADIVSMQIFVTDVARLQGGAARARAACGSGTSAAATRPPGCSASTRLFDDEALIELMALAVLAEDAR